MKTLEVNNISITTADTEMEKNIFFISGTGRLFIVNTGGASSSEGGMGSGNDDETSKGDLSKPGERTGTSDNEETEEGFDPIGKNIKEKEKEAGKE